jgi:hypothetical protein
MVGEGGRREALPKNSLTLTGNKEKKKMHQENRVKSC